MIQSFVIRKCDGRKRLMEVCKQGSKHETGRNEGMGRFLHKRSLGTSGSEPGTSGSEPGTSGSEPGASGSEPGAFVVPSSLHQMAK